jgi:hypothetical protein
MMSDREFRELELKVLIVPGQCEWPKLEYGHWQKLHQAANEARERVSKTYAQMDEIDGNAKLSHEDKQHRRSEVADHALAEFEASQTLIRARDAVRYDASPDLLKALKQAEAGWGRAMNKIAERAALTNGSRRPAMIPSQLLKGWAH